MARTSRAIMIRVGAQAATPVSVSQSRIFCLGMAPTFIDTI
jgi:hypothetical protein